MKLSRRLIPAFAMLLVSAVLMSTASFAWFSMNSEVKAEGMTVNAAASTSLVIRGKDEETFDNIGTNDLEALDLIPVTSSNGVNFAMLNANTVEVKAANGSAATWSGTDGAFKDGDLVDASGKFKATTSYVIKNIGAPATAVYVKNITVTAAEDDDTELTQAVRVGIQLESGTMLVFNAGRGSNNDGKVGAKQNDKWVLVDTVNATNNTSVYTALGTEAANIGALPLADTEYTVNVVIWFEGQDSQCFSDNIPTEGISVNIEFTTNLAE